MNLSLPSDCYKRKNKMNYIINEGGAAGHLSHLYDNKDLTFAEIKDIFTQAAHGKLQKISEKLDGMNLVFTWDVSSRTLRVARTGSDITKGGMDAEALAKKFFGRANIEDAFNNAFKILNDAMASLNDDVCEKIFGEHGNKWYSIEIIYAASPNTINYDSNNVVFHGWPIFEISPDGKVEQIEDDSGVDILSKNIDQMQNALSVKNWRVRGPSLLRLKSFSDGTIINKSLSELDSIMATGNVSDNDTIYDYLRSLMSHDVKKLKLPKLAEKATIERCVGVDGAPTVNDIKKMLTKEQAIDMANFVRSSPDLLKKYVLPIEDNIQRFAIEVLRGLRSTLISNSDDEVARLKTQLTKAIKTIEASGNQEAMEILKKEMLRLGSIENLASAMEGIVFFYKGNAYKFTGAFAPAHQILSLFKYGRKGIKFDALESTRKNNKLLIEGGNAFPDVVSISLSDLETTWSFIRNNLFDLGVTHIEPIGSTLKKDLMGDVDLAVEYADSRDQLYKDALKKFGNDSVKIVGSNIVTIKHPVYTIIQSGIHKTNSYVQIDMMIGDSKYLKWSRWGASTIKDHQDYSIIKGGLRNVFLNAIVRELSNKLLPGKSTELDRERFVVDHDLGLYKVKQTRRNNTEGKPPTKGWKTLERVFITKSPNEIVKKLFGSNFHSNNTKTFEQLVNALKTSPNTSDLADDILLTFLNELPGLLVTNKKVLGDDPQKVIDYVESIVIGT